MPVVASPLRIITTATTNATTHAPTCCVKILKQSLVTHADRESARGSKWEHLKVFRGWRKDTQSAAGVHSAYRQPRDQRTSGHYPHGSCIGVSCVEMSSPILQQESGVAVTYHKVVFFSILSRRIRNYYTREGRGNPSWKVYKERMCCCTEERRGYKTFSSHTLLLQQSLAFLRPSFSIRR